MKLLQENKVIGIVGSRRRNNEDDLIKIEKLFLEIYKPGDSIVSGGCPLGGDHFAEIIAQKLEIPIKIYYAEWKEYGKGAGIKRNTYIAEDCDVLIACVASDRKGGTEDTIKKVKRLKKEVLLV